MYLHAGGDTIVPCSEIIAILSYEAVKFDGKEKGVYKSVIITCGGNKYYSDISSKTLINRFECFLIKDVDNSVSGL